jgi:glycopeptide antibiotics resistance protein
LDTALTSAAGIVLLISPDYFRRRQHSLSYLLCFAVLGVYLVFALNKTLFPLNIGGDYHDDQVPLRSFVNLIPFYPGPWGYSEGFFLTNLQNIALTIPFGFGVNFVVQVRAKSIFWIALSIGLGIETVQLAISLTGLSHPYRLADVNDVIMNALGVLIGYGIFRVFAWLYLLITHRLGIEHRGLAAYI